jgi:hypothetical protein
MGGGEALLSFCQTLDSLAGNADFQRDAILSFLAAMSLGSSLGRSGHRDDRRRRLLAEEYAHGTEVGDQSLVTQTEGSGGPGTMRAAPVHKSQNYGDADFLAEQPRLTDLIPRRVSTLAVTFVLGLAAIGGLVALGAGFPEALARPGGRRPAALDLAAAGSLGRWFSSLLLLAAGLTALLVYNIRRHKVNDYQGRYRIWAWAAACCFLVASDTATSLGDVLGEVMTALAGTRLLGDGSIWWIVPAACLLGAVGSRLLVDMWEFRGSTAAALLATCCYAAAIAIHCGWIAPDDAAWRLAGQAAGMTGHLLLLTALGLHARHVLLDAEGRLPRPRPATGAEPADEATTDSEASTDGDSEVEATSQPPDRDTGDGPSATSDRWVAVDPSHGKGQPVLRRVGSTGLPSTTPAAATPAAPSPPALPTSAHKLTKADRKALKKRLLEERLKRQKGTSPNWGR